MKFLITRNTQGRSMPGIPVEVEVTEEPRDGYDRPCKCERVYRVSEASIPELKRLRLTLTSDRMCICDCHGFVVASDFDRELSLHLTTWGPHCGAPLDVYEGHLRKLLGAHAAGLLPPKPQPFMPRLERPVVFLDIESTGVDVVLDRIIDLAVVVLHPDGNRKSFSIRFNPGMPIPPESTAIHGITDEDVKDCPLFNADWARKIHAGLQDRDFGGYNVRRMDLPMIDEHLRRHGLRLDMTGVRVFDAAGIFFAKNPRKLADCVRRYCGRELDGAHGALADTEGSLDAFLHQLGEHPELREMSLDELSEYCANSEHKLADLAGKLYRDSDGVMRLAFGKEKDKSVSEAVGFCYWLLRCDNPPFPGSTCEVLRAELKRLGL